MSFFKDFGSPFTTNYFLKVTLVAQLVEDIEPQSTNILFKLDDGTGRIDARHWLESYESADTYSQLK